VLCGDRADLDAVARESFMGCVKVVHPKSNRRSGEIKVVRILFHNLERDELKRELLPRKSNLHNGELTDGGSLPLYHADLFDPERQAMLKIVDVQDHIADMHLRSFYFVVGAPAAARSLYAPASMTSVKPSSFMIATAWLERLPLRQ
jgi:hypothetical protein